MRKVLEALERATAQAVREGLVDAWYWRQPSPLGRLTVVTTDAGVCAVAFPEADEETLEEVAAALGPNVCPARGETAEVRRQLDEYFRRKREEFELLTDLRLTTEFRQRVLRRLEAVPYGATMTYAELAAAVGRPRGPRAIGQAVGHNPVPIIVPCHRVVGSDGTLTGYGGGLDRKRLLLDLERRGKR
jgi:methylated-DNA-[protein]-cysteine S-methyltransferase